MSFVLVRHYLLVNLNIWTERVDMNSLSNNDGMPENYSITTESLETLSEGVDINSVWNNEGMPENDSIRSESNNHLR